MGIADGGSDNGAATVSDSESVFPIDKPFYCVILRAYRIGPVAIELKIG